MRLALAGKGGVGKTTLTATLARMLARSGRTVVCVDADSNPNLAFALGIQPEVYEATAHALPFGLVSRKLDGPSLIQSVESVLDEHAMTAPDGVRLALMGMPGHADEGCLCSAHATVSGLLGDLGKKQDWMTLVDMEASPEHLGRGTTRHVDMMLFVTEPYYRSLETVRRMAELAAELPIKRVAVVANKVRSEADATAIGEFCERHGLDVFAVVPRSDVVVDADIQRTPLLDFAPNDPAVQAIDAIVQRLLEYVPVGI